MTIDEAAKAGATIGMAEAERTKLFCGLRNGGSYAFDAMRWGAEGFRTTAGVGFDGPAREGARPETDREGAYGCEIGAYGSDGEGAAYDEGWTGACGAYGDEPSVYAEVGPLEAPYDVFVAVIGD